jgi:hypothetical protein
MDSKYTVVQSSGVHNFYWVSIVHPPSHFQDRQQYAAEIPSRSSFIFIFIISFFFFLIGLGDGDWVRVEEGEITLCCIVPLIIISTPPDPGFEFQRGHLFFGISPRGRYHRRVLPRSWFPLLPQVDI